MADPTTTHKPQKETRITYKKLTVVEQGRGIFELSITISFRIAIHLVVNIAPLVEANMHLLPL